MNRCTSFFAMLIVFVSIGLSGTARAEAFATPALDNILKTLVRYGALDINLDEVIDLYGSIMTCDLYREFYQNDFKWNKIRGVLRESVKKDVGLFPTGYKYDTTLQFGKYDFKNKIYRFSNKTAQINVNVFKLTAHQTDHCDKHEGIRLPNDFRLVLREPALVLGIPMNEEEGQKIFDRMDKAGNKDHLIYARFNIQVIYVEPFVKKEINFDHKGNEDFRKGLPGHTLSVGEIRLDGRLDSIEYFEDKARTKLIYKYEPSEAL